MPPINRYTCNECGLELPAGWGVYTYAVDDRGERVTCPHPGEFQTIREVTGMDYAEARAAGRMGYAQHCICGRCLQQFDLDLDRDARVCPGCSSPDVRSLRESVGKRCPQCGVGLIEEGSLVRWELDADWEQLPVPEVVKDLLRLLEDRKVPEALRPAAAAAERFDRNTLFTVGWRLLDWWEGEYFSKDQEQKDSEEMQPQWTWCMALPEVLRVTPALAELVVIRGGRCWFAEGVSAEVRRGIKNYLRKHRKHEVEA